MSESTERSAMVQARELMIAAAAGRRTMTYGQMAETMTALDLSPRDGRLYRLLDTVSVEENAAGHGLLSVVVVRQDTGLPGDGFFGLAKSLGRDVQNETAFWQSEYGRVCDFWSATRR